MDHAFGIIFETSLPKPWLERFSLRCCLVLSFAFRSVIYFELIFVFCIILQNNFAS